MNDFILWMGEFIYGNSHVSETSLLLTALFAFGVFLVMVHFLNKINPVPFGIFGVIALIAGVFYILYAIMAIPFVHELRFSECRNEKSVASINEIEVDVVSTYCRYKKHTLDDAWGNWKLVGIRQKDADN